MYSNCAATINCPPLPCVQAEKWCVVNSIRGRCCSNGGVCGKGGMLWRLHTSNNVQLDTFSTDIHSLTHSNTKAGVKIIIVYLRLGMAHL